MNFVDLQRCSVTYDEMSTIFGTINVFVLQIHKEKISLSLKNYSFVKVEIQQLSTKFLGVKLVYMLSAYKSQYCPL